MSSKATRKARRAAARETQMPEPVENWNERRLHVGSKAVGSLMTDGSLHTRSGAYFDSVERPYLAEYESALRNDPYLHRIFAFIALSMVSSLGPYIHKDRQAMVYVERMRNEMEGNLEQGLYEAIYCACWGGASVSEKIIEANEGLVWIRRLVNYHPNSVWLVPNRQGRLTEGEPKPAHPFLPYTGIWQRMPLAWQASTELRPRNTRIYQQFIQLPKAKMVLLTHNSRHGNIAGESMLSPIWNRKEMADKS